MLSSSIKINFIKIFRPVFISLLLISSLSTAWAAPTNISCVLVDLNDGEKEEYEISFDDGDRTTIRVDGMRVPVETRERLYTLENFGSSIIKWTSTKKNVTARISATYIIDRSSGSMERIQTLGDKVFPTHKGSCSKASESKRF